MENKSDCFWWYWYWPQKQAAGLGVLLTTASVVFPLEATGVSATAGVGLLSIAFPSVAITAITFPIPTTSSTLNNIWLMTPLAGEGISESTLSVAISRIVSSASTESPTCFDPFEDGGFHDAFSHLGHNQFYLRHNLDWIGLVILFGCAYFFKAALMANKITGIIPLIKIFESYLVLDSRYIGYSLNDLSPS